MEAPWEVAPLGQETGAPTAPTLAPVQAMGQQQKGMSTEAMGVHSVLASMETWTTASWLCGCRRAYSVKACYKGWRTLSRAHPASLGPKGPPASARSSLPTAT